MNKEQIERMVLVYINSTPELLSLLYDLDLMPEQLDRNSKDWHRMMILTGFHQSIREMYDTVP